MRAENKAAILLLIFSCTLLTITMQGVKIRDLRRDLKIEQERLLDVQNTCRQYEDEIIKLYGEMDND